MDQSIEKNLDEVETAEVTIYGEEVNLNADNKDLIVSFKGKLNEKGEHFFIISKMREPDVYVPVYKSECKAASKGETDWVEFVIDIQTLAGEEMDNEI